MVPANDDRSLQGCRIAFLSWRDTGNPEGGGAERYLAQMAAGLVERGARVTVFSAAYRGAAPDETVDGVRYVRRGTKLTVYSQGMWQLARRRLGRVDVVVDVQNGLPFFTPLVRRGPVVVLVHHVHREQWPVVYPGFTGRIGWWVESWLAPRLYRRRQYVVVSDATRTELSQLGVDQERIAVVHNGSDPVVAVQVDKSAHPSYCVVGRLVPHKQVEHAIDAAGQLRNEFPDLAVRIVGSGWWEPELRQYVAQRGLDDIVHFEGHVSEVRKQEVYEESWVMALPSVKEGWGLVVGEAAAHGTPTVAYASAGGTRESIDDGVSGLLVDDRQEFTRTLGRLLREPDLRARLAHGAGAHSARYSWHSAQHRFALVVGAAIAGELVGGDDAVDD